MIDIVELRRLAIEATPGPWITDTPNGELVARMVTGHYDYILAVRPDDFSETASTYEQNCANANYIAAISPDVLLKLLDVVDVVDAARRLATEDAAEFAAADLALKQALAALDAHAAPRNETDAGGV